MGHEKETTAQVLKIIIFDISRSFTKGPVRRFGKFRSGKKIVSACIAYAEEHTGGGKGKVGRSGSG